MAQPESNGSPRVSRPLRRAVSAGLAAVLTATLLPAAAQAQEETPAEEAAREIQDARDEANAAADAYFAAESTLDQLEDDLAGLLADELVLQANVDDLRVEVEAIALERYVQSGTEGIPLLTDVSEPQDQVQAEVFVDVLTNTSADVLDQFGAAQDALEDTQEEVAERQDEIEAQKEAFAALEVAALGEVERLREIEADRLQDEAVQKALDAQIAAERAELVEQARLDAEAAARAQPNPGLVVPETVPTTTTTTIVTDPGAAGSAPVDPEGDTVATGTGVDAAPETAPSTTTAPTLPPETTLPPNSGSSGGTSGGRTGGGGGGNNPAGIDTGAGYIDNIICPMPGGAYGDTWGAPRSGGRRHEGVDIIGPRGLPLYAVVSGQITYRSNTLGGNTISLLGDNGNRYYYAHLDAYEGGNRRVVQGEVVGYNGDSGNAKFSTPHLHFQIMPGNGRPVNPYPSVRAAGC